MSRMTCKSLNCVIVYLIFCSCSVGYHTDSEYSQRLAQDDKLAFFRKYFGKEFHHLLPYIRISKRGPITNYDKNNVSPFHETIKEIGNKGKINNHKDNQEENISERNEIVKNELTGEDLTEMSLFGSETENIGNEMRGWLFNTFPEEITPSPVDAKTGMCKDTQTLVLNKSMSCNYNSLRKITLSDNQLVQYLSDEGGNYVKDYMAPNEATAKDNFKNLISLTEDYEDLNFKKHPSNWIWDYNQTKAKLLEQLELSHMQLMSSMFHEEPAQKTQAENYWQLWVDGTARALQTWHSNTVKPSYQATLLSKLVPAKYMIPPSRRHKRAADGTTSTMEYCQNRGSETTDGYLRMCTMCSHTTTLPDDRFPRVLNEAVCHSVDSGCLFVGTTPHGSCRQNVFYMNMLRKKAGSCMMVIHDGATVLSDEWEIYSQPIRVACECLVNKRSPMAKNINPN